LADDLEGTGEGTKSYCLSLAFGSGGLDVLLEVGVGLSPCFD